MYGIGTVARLAQVSVRTLRHYDGLGLLKPAHVDPVTGYRFYAPEQVAQLHRILVLRDLGVPLTDIRQLIDDEVTIDQLRGILHRRQSEAQARLAALAQQLKRVEIRLAQLEEGSMGTYEMIVKRLDPMRVVALSEDLVGIEEISDACGRMYPQLHAALQRHNVRPDRLSLALYEDTGDEQKPMRLTTALPVPSDVTIEGDGLRTIELAGVESAATTVVRGAPDKFHEAFLALHDWVDEAGHKRTSVERELYIDCDGPPETWVTELQVPLELAP